MILNQILEKRKIQLSKEKKAKSLEDIFKELEEKKDLETPCFVETLKNHKELSIIAEIKKASPSKGIIKEDFDVTEIAKAYEKADVQAISILTENHYFQGKTQNITIAKQYTNKPILRKDFIFDAYQVYEAKNVGASCILLIVAMLKSSELKSLLQLSKELKIDALVEVHDEEEAKIALEAEANIVGVNNRNLKDFSMDLKTTERVMKILPKQILCISESGIHTKEDFDYVKSLGVKGVLIGESLMKAENIEKQIKALRG